MISAVCSFGWWLMAGAGFVLGEKYCWLVDGGWFVLRENYCCLVPDKPSEHGVQLFFFCLLFVCMVAAWKKCYVSMHFC
jgi:hypothetical protein